MAAGPLSKPVNIAAVLVVIGFFATMFVDDSFVATTGKALAVSRYARWLFIFGPLTGLYFILFPRSAARQDAKYRLGRPLPPVEFYMAFGWILIVVPIVVFLILNRQ